MRYTEEDVVASLLEGFLKSRLPIPSNRSLVRSRRTRRIICTAAQDETEVHRPFLENLVAYARHLGAELMVGGFTYQKGLFEDHATRTGLFAADIQPFLRHEQVDFGRVVFAAEMNILPTAVKPLSGLQTYSRGRPAVFPHAKIQLESIPTRPGGDVPIITTTGCCTISNYVLKKAGLKAAFHHVIGATIVEIDDDGDWFLRQINADHIDGSFQDLDVIVRDGRASGGHRVEAITWGDVHREQLDPVNARTAWGYDTASDTCVSHDSMLDALRPRHQFFHDLLDFRSRNHHSRWDPHHMFAMVANGTDSIETAIRSCVALLRGSQRPWAQSVVVESNHDRALMRWLKEGNWQADPVNAQAYLRWNGKVLGAIEQGDRRFNVFREALREADATQLAGITFVPQDGSYLIAGDIECGMHGDDGPNGSRGALTNLIKLSMKVNVGHSHTAGISDGAYQGGMNGRLNQGYNHGPTSWTPTDIVTYSSGKRTLVTKRGSKWKAV